MPPAFDADKKSALVGVALPLRGPPEGRSPPLHGVVRNERGGLDRSEADHDAQRRHKFGHRRDWPTVVPSAARRDEATPSKTPR
jgi:hypothetical protein